MKNSHTIHWKGHLSIRTSAQSARDLLDALSNYSRVIVDTSELASVDVSHLQILVAAMKFAGTLGSRLDVLSVHGSALDEALHRTGLVDPLDARLLRSDGAWTGIAVSTGGYAA